MKLNIGCGKRNFGEDWIHIDGSDYEHIHSHDIVNLPFEENIQWRLVDLDLELIDEVRNQWAFYRDRRPSTYEDLVTP